MDFIMLFVLYGEDQQLKTKRKCQIEDVDLSGDAGNAQKI